MVQRWWGLGLVVLLSTGCYTTKVYSARPAASWKRSDRQWFTVGGLVDLSDPAGQECSDGLAYAESRLAVMDWLINGALFLGGAVVGSSICNADDRDERAACVTGTAGLATFLLSSRTVSYTCAGGSLGHASALPSPAKPQRPGAPPLQLSPPQ